MIAINIHGTFQFDGTYMTYTINHTDGTELVINPDELNAETSLTFAGKTSINSWFYINNNLVRLLENFANPDAPANPIVGQLWYDNDNKALKLYNNDWVTFGVIQPDLSRYVQTHNDTMSGSLNIPASPTTKSSIASRSYVQRYLFNPTLTQSDNVNYIVYPNKYMIMNLILSPIREVLLPVEMANTNYTVLVNYSTKRSTGPETTHITVYNKTRSAFNIKTNEPFDSLDIIIMGFIT